jgi:hypothetical protein
VIRTTKAEKDKWDQFRNARRWTRNDLIRRATNRFIQTSREEPSSTDPTKQDPIIDALNRIEQKLDNSVTLNEEKTNQSSMPAAVISNRPSETSNLVDAIVQLARDSKHRNTLAKCKTVDEFVIALEELNHELPLSSQGAEPVTAVDEALSILRKMKIVECDKRGFLKWNMSKSLVECMLSS